MRRFFSLLPLLIISFVSPADWKVEKNRNDSSKTADSIAIIENGQGDSFSLYRISNRGEVWARFKLHGDFTDTADWNTPPMLRIDNNKPISLSRQKDLQVMGVGVDAYKGQQGQIEFLIWHGKESEGLSEFLAQIMGGNKLIVRYYLSSGSYKESTFPLTDAETTISSALKISRKASLSTPQKTTTFKEFVLLEIKQCLQQTASTNTCLKRIKECRNKADKEINKFNSCYR
ncbi:MAG: hypothetical protein JAY97_12325 [Candidatus Thiodiazotropha sp. 'RUGA']|nr:hypothetical protein [Candidatus Thiodiazotropha sp. 'RUGA']